MRQVMAEMDCKVQLLVRLYFMLVAVVVVEVPKLLLQVLADQVAAELEVPLMLPQLMEPQIQVAVQVRQDLKMQTQVNLAAQVAQVL
jgi:hypothetical protein